MGPRIALVVSLLVVLGGGALYATKSGRTSNSGSAAPKQQGPVQRYTVRGRLQDLPDPARPASGLAIHHEEIKDFVRKDGTLGMSEMTMNFPYADSVSFDGLAVGDSVEFLFEVNWAGSPLFQVTSITRLPADTQLEFESSSDE